MTRTLRQIVGYVDVTLPQKQQQTRRGIASSHGPSCLAFSIEIDALTFVQCNWMNSIGRHPVISANVAFWFVARSFIWDQTLSIAMPDCLNTVTLKCSGASR
jgi:hypothetical protein